ncbi:DUF6088 family protein [Marinilabilia salmonicolor]|uniref:DUF6088 family protein n=1 Tax=Marinilabilia salmonicolor TaxID=989 RepID=UPI000299DA8E|nr:DUF6088 family protein [Marinilabilia salmonicolor]
MKVTENISSTIKRLPRGYVFTYADFTPEVSKKEAVIKALNRMVQTGKLKKLSKGKYYKPEESAFGTLPPDQFQIVKDLLEKNGKITGYLTGYSIYNQLGLTTQISNVIQIGRNETRPAFSRGMYKISFIKQKNTITKENIPQLQLLDAIRFIKTIPDTTIDNSCIILKGHFKKLPFDKQQNLIRLALLYPPSTRALLGAILEEINSKIELKTLKNSLNPITKYKLNISPKTLSTLKNWNIL